MLMNQIEKPSDYYHENLLPAKKQSKKFLHWVKSVKTINEICLNINKPSSNPMRVFQMKADDIKYDPEELDEENLQLQVKLTESEKYNTHLKLVYDREVAEAERVWRKMRPTNKSIRVKHGFIKNVLQNRTDVGNLGKNLEVQISEIEREIRRTENKTINLEKDERFSVLQTAISFKEELQNEERRLTDDFIGQKNKIIKNEKEQQKFVLKDIEKIENEINVGEKKNKKLNMKFDNEFEIMAKLKKEIENKQFHLEKVVQESEVYAKKVSHLEENFRKLKRLIIKIENE